MWQRVSLFHLAVLLCSTAGLVWAEEGRIKDRLDPEDWAYALPEGIEAKEVTFYSDGVACFGQIFFPKDFDAEGRTPGIVLAEGWGGTAKSIGKYAARFAEHGLVSMVIDYRGWGLSDGFLSRSNRAPGDDAVPVTETETKVRVKRTRILPLKQVEDYRNAIAYLQGEAGVDGDRIGVWGTNYSGGHTIAVAAVDARVKAAVAQVPAIAGKNLPEGPLPMNDKMVEDAIKRAREGQGDVSETGFSIRRTIDVETFQMHREYRPYHTAKHVTIPVLLIVAEKDQLIRNEDNAYAVAEVLANAKVIEIPGITHFDIYTGEAFDRATDAAADWFKEHLGAK